MVATPHHRNASSQPPHQMKELENIEKLLEEMQFQQQEMPPQMLYAVVENVMSEIVKDPKYTDLVLFPIRERYSIH